MPNDESTKPELTTTNPNELAVRLYLIDMSLQHLARSQGVLGLGGNVVRESLMEEKDTIVAALKELGEPIVPGRRRA